MTSSFLLFRYFSVLLIKIRRDFSKYFFFRKFIIFFNRKIAIPAVPARRGLQSAFIFPSAVIKSCSRHLGYDFARAHLLHLGKQIGRLPLLERKAQNDVV